MYDVKKQTHLRIYNLKKVLDYFKGRKSMEGEQADLAYEHEIIAPKDNILSHVVWGPLNKSLFMTSDLGNIFKYDIAKKEYIKSERVHEGEIFSIELTPDFTMLITCSRDGTAKLLNRDTFEVWNTYVFKGGPCRSASVSPLYLSRENQKFHMIIAGGQDAKEVAVT